MRLYSRRLRHKKVYLSQMLSLKNHKIKFQSTLEQNKSFVLLRTNYKLLFPNNEGLLFHKTKWLCLPIPLIICLNLYYVNT